MFILKSDEDKITRMNIPNENKCLMGEVVRRGTREARGRTRENRVTCDAARMWLPDGVFSDSGIFGPEFVIFGQ